MHFIAFNPENFAQNAKHIFDGALPWVDYQWAVCWRVSLLKMSFLRYSGNDLNHRFYSNPLQTKSHHLLFYQFSHTQSTTTISHNNHTSWMFQLSCTIRLHPSIQPFGENACFYWLRMKSFDARIAYEMSDFFLNDLLCKWDYGNDMAVRIYICVNLYLSDSFNSGTIDQKRMRFALW